MKSTIFLLFIFLLSNLAVAQTTITGTVKDETTQQPIPFVSIGIIGTYQGTLSDEWGNFELKVPQMNSTDTIRISAIGYKNLSLSKKEMDSNKEQVYFLSPIVYDLTEIKIKPKKLQYKTLGTSKYSITNCTAFMGKDENWKGEQAAILANNKEEVRVYIESFGFYIIKNEYKDSLQFRIMLYEVNPEGYPGKTFLKKPILFKTAVKQGEVQIDLKPYEINTVGDFFISLECLEEKMESAKFCFAGSIKVPTYFKTSAFSRWGKVKGGGGDFNIKVSYKK